MILLSPDYGQFGRNFRAYFGMDRLVWNHTGSSHLEFWLFLFPQLNMIQFLTVDLSLIHFVDK